MNRRKFVKQTVAGLVASEALRFSVGELSAAEAPIVGARSVTVAAKPAPISLDLTKLW